MKIVFVCTGQPDSLYVSMTGVVAAAARIVEPGAQPIVFTDEASAGAGVGRALEDVAEVVIPPMPHFDPMVASRWLKVRLRSLVDGDFLFLDADALPAARLAPALARVRHVGAVPDSTGLRRPGACPRWVQQLYGELGWRVPSAIYFNSGVMFWRDTEQARQLGRAWENAWETTRALGDARDQPSLLHAIDTSQVEPDALPASMNTFVEVDPHRVPRAKVLHFFAGIPNRSATLVDALAAARRRGDRLDWRSVESAMRTGSVWTGMTARQARSRIARGTLRSTWRLLADGHRRDAFWAARHAVRIAPWKLDAYGMVVRTLVTRAPGSGTPAGK